MCKVWKRRNNIVAARSTCFWSLNHLNKKTLVISRLHRCQKWQWSLGCDFNVCSPPRDLHLNGWKIRSGNSKALNQKHLRKWGEKKRAVKLTQQNNFSEAERRNLGDYSSRNNCVLLERLLIWTNISLPGHGMFHDRRNVITSHRVGGCDQAVTRKIPDNSTTPPGDLQDDPRCLRHWRMSRDDKTIQTFDN